MNPHPPRDAITMCGFLLLAWLSLVAVPTFAQDAPTCGMQVQTCVLQCRQDSASPQPCLSRCGDLQTACRADEKARRDQAEQQAAAQPLAKPMNREQLMQLASQFFSGGGDRVQIARRALQSFDLDMAQVPLAGAERENALRTLAGSYSNFLGADMRLSPDKVVADPALVITRGMRTRYEAALAGQAAPGVPGNAAGPQMVAAVCASKRRDDAQLIAALRGTLEAAERDIDSLRSRNFVELHEDVFLPQLKCLVASARDQLAVLPAAAGSAGRFAKWDNDVGGPALVLASRWAALPLRRSYGLLNRNDVMANDGGLERGNWQALAGSASPQAADLADELRRVIDARTPAAKPLSTAEIVPVAGPEARKPRAAPEPITVIATPRTMALALASARAGRGIGQFIGFVVNQRREYLQLEQRIAQSRNDYWRCRQSGCADLEARQAGFVEALMLKDLYILNMKTDSVLDGGLVPGCQREYSSLREAATALVGINVEVDADAWDREARAVFTSKSYAGWQACRDRAEYVARPRPALL